jgi:hypothetical protein
MTDSAESLENQVEELEQRVSELENRLDGTDEPTVGAGLQEFVEEKNPSSHTERSLYIAYYLETQRGLDEFTVSDIEDAYRECRVQAAGNMSDVLGRMEGQNWLLRAGTEGRAQLWKLTTTALEYIEGGSENGSK